MGINRPSHQAKRSVQYMENASYDEDFDVLARQTLEYSPKPTTTGDPELKRKVTELLQTKIDEADSSNTYIGKAAHGVASSVALWQIKKIVTSGTVTTISFADGVDTFTKEWDERVSYSY